MCRCSVVFHCLEMLLLSNTSFSTRFILVLCVWLFSLKLHSITKSVKTVYKFGLGMFISVEKFKCVYANKCE